jgi:hypothetical protein
MSIFPRYTLGGIVRYQGQSGPKSDNQQRESGGHQRRCVWCVSPSDGVVGKWGTVGDCIAGIGDAMKWNFNRSPSQVVPIVTGERYFLHFSALLAALRVWRGWVVMS